MPKSLPLPVILLLFCVSCETTFQFSTLSSPDLILNDRHEFVVENDSLKLTYNFNGDKGPIHITIQNKMGVPVYIDWQRSAIIVNDKAVPYATAEVNIAGSFEGSPSWSNGYKVNSGQLQATAVLPPTIDFIPPRAIINKNPMFITNGVNNNIPDTAFKKLNYAVTEGVTVKAKKATFTEANSPLRFRSFITYMIGEPGTKPFAFENNFFVSEVMNTSAGPIEMSVSSGNRGDQYYSIQY
jgi:hypothetical protein